ncbi:hypothetical protein, partial [Subsaximicrobium wynnwilliamsii]|uniref:hypothetical protein n=1 Tax=Subsaximicrobium wynnwilliamsii TaxID=291179 RepID=UPI001CB90448
FLNMVLDLKFSYKLINLLHLQQEHPIGTVQAGFRPVGRIRSTPCISHCWVCAYLENSWEFSGGVLYF